MDLWLQDVRFAWRRLIHSPGFAAAAILTLALGIGANAIVFGFLNALILQPLPVSHPEELVFLNSGANGSGPNFSHPNYRDLRDRNDVFSALIAYRLTVMSLAADGRTDRLWGYLVTGNYFDALGVQAIRGRTFTPDDDRVPGGHPIVVISHGCWQRRFGGAADVVGKTVSINQQPFTIVGVAPAGFRGTESFLTPDVFIPLTMQAQIEIGNAWLESRQTHNMWLLGRLRPGVARARAEASLNAIAAQLAREYPRINEGMRIRLAPPGVLGNTLRGAILGFGTMLLASAGLALLIACVNLANLMLARGADRRREIAMYVALGASAGQVVRQLVVEAMLLAAAGGAVALLLAFWVARALTAWHPPLDVPIAVAVGIDARVIGFALALTIATTIATGLLPAWRASRIDLVPALKNERPFATLRRWELRDLLVLSQIALSTIVLVVAVLMTRGLQSALRLPIGYNPDGAVSASFDLRFHGYDRARGSEFQRRLLERLRATPGLDAVALTNAVPLSIDVSTNDIYVEGEPAPPASQVPHAIIYRPSAGYFRTMQTAVVQGREFTDADRTDSPPVVVVNQTFVKQILRGRDAIVARVRFGPTGDPMAIVGVAEDGKYGSLGENPTPVIFRPLAQAYNATTIVVARSAMSTGPAGDALQTVRRVILDLDPSIGIYDAGSLSDQLRLPLLPARIAAAGIGMLGVLTLILAATGLYGVLSYAVARRQREIGIRVAIGATPAQVFRTVLGRTAGVLAIGGAVGLASSLLVSRLLTPYLYGASDRDPWALATVAAAMTCTAALALWMPARRAIAVDPTIALRAE
jgi:predicted permease